MKKYLVTLLILLFATISHAQLISGGGGLIGPMPPVITSTDCSIYIQDGKLCFDTDDDKFYVGNGTTVVEIANSATAFTFNAPLSLKYGTSPGLLKIYEGSGSGTNYVGLQGVTAGSDQTYTLWSAYPSANNLAAIGNTNGTFSWNDQPLLTTSSPTFANITDSGLTVTRVPFAGTAGLLVDDSDMTFATDTLTVTKLIGSTSVTSPTIYGSSAENGDIDIYGTSHGTHTTSYINLLDNTILGTNTTGKNLTIKATEATNTTPEMSGLSGVNWTYGANWTIAVGVATCNGTAGTLVPTTPLTIVAGTNYKVSFTISGYASGSVTMTLGGVLGTIRGADGVFTARVTAADTNNLIFTPSSFVGGISAVTVQVVTQGTLTVEGVNTFAGRTILESGSAYAPAIVWSTDATKLGIYRHGTSSIGFADSGTLRHYFDNAEYWINSNTAKIEFGTAADLTISRSAANALQIGVNAADNSAVTQTIQSAASTTDVAGAKLAIQANKGSGTTYAPLLLNPSGGNVGIGTTGPGEALHVIGRVRIANGTAALPSLNFQNGTITGLFDVDNGITSGVGISSGGVEVMRAIDGNVGIGTTGPYYKNHTWGGSIGVQDPATLGSESLTNPNLTSGTSWTQTNDCALTGDAATWTFAAGTASILKQAVADMVGASSPRANRWYKFTYTVSGITGTPTANITTSVASATTALTITAGAQTTYFLSAAVPSDFIITSTLTTGQVFTLDTFSLKEIIDGDLFLGGDIYSYNGSIVGSSTALTISSIAGNSDIVLDPAGTGVVSVVGSLNTTGTRITKGWFTDIETTNMPTINGAAITTILQPLDANLTSLAGLSHAIGDLIYATAATTYGSLADVAAGQPLLSGGVTTAPAYAGYTFSGTAGQTYTFPGASATLLGTNATVTVAQGGTGTTTFALNGVLYGNTTSAIGVTAIGTEGQILRVGASPFVPAWSTSTFADTYAIGGLLVASAANTVTALATGTTGQILVGVTGAVPAWGTDLPTATTIGSAYVYRVGGTDVSVADGGTGLSSGTEGGIPWFTTTTTMATSALLAANAVMVGGGVDAAPNTITSTATSGYVLTAQGVGTAPVWSGTMTGTFGGFTANRAVYSDASGNLIVHATLTDTELGYVDGVTSAIQTQLDTKQPSIKTIVDGSAALVLTTAQVSGTVITNSTQGLVDINHTLPTAGAGYSFKAIVTEGSANYWRFTRSGSDTVCLDGTCAKTYVSIATPTQGATLDCNSLVIATTGIKTGGALAMGSTKDKVANGAFTFDILGVAKAKAADAIGTELNAVTTPQNKYGAQALDIGADGTIDPISCTNIATGFDTAGEAVTDLPAVEAGHTRIGYVTAMNTDAGGFIWGTTEFDVATVTEAFTSSTAYTKPYGWVCTTIKGTWATD